MFEADIRMMAVVNRWGIVPTTRHQNDAEHTYFVAFYANDISIALGLDVTTCLAIQRMALWHDLDEILWGDPPGPHKSLIYDKAKKAKSSKQYMELIFGHHSVRDGEHLLPIHSTEYAIAKDVLKVADLMEAVLFLKTEMSMGNGNVSDHCDVLFKAANDVLAGMSTLGVDIEKLEYVSNKMHEARHNAHTTKNSRITY